MTASSLQVTPGSGLRLATNSYTEGGVTVHDEKMILGEQLLASYTYTDSASVATANSHLAQITGSASLRIRVRRIELWQTDLATTARLFAVRIVRLTTAGTGGTVVVPRALDPADAAFGGDGMRLPTTKGTEGVTVAGGTGYLMQTAGASVTMPTPLLVWDFDRPRTPPLIIAAGTSNGIAVKNLTSDAAGALDVMIWLSTSSY